MKLKYSFEIEIKRPLDEVIRLFNNRDHLRKWQKGLLSSEALPSSDGHERYMLMFAMGRRKMKITETILKNDFPVHYDVNYKIKGAQHTMYNSFSLNGRNATKWVSEVEYEFKGLMHFLAGFNKSGFEQQILWYMQSFKTFAEKDGGK